MRVIVCNNYDEMSKRAAKMVASQITLKPNCVLGLATGSTPIGLYDELAEMNRIGDIDFSDVTTFNLDEYYPISPDNSQSYRYFMNEHLFGKVNIDINRTHVPNGQADNAAAECENYEKMIDAAGGIDLQILGIGQNGHIGFNEPDTNLNTTTHLTELATSTIDANSRLFDKKEDVPRRAITMGIASILKSRKIILLASGRTKYNVVRELLNDGINTSVPATMLKVHPDVVLICDKEAYASMYLGVDVGGTSIKFGVVDGYNNIVYKDSLPTEKDKPEDAIIDKIADACVKISERFPISSVGIGIPGIINSKTNTVSSVNLPFNNTPVLDILKKKINLPIYINNDANCAALAEAVAGEGTAVDDMFMVTIGTGIGGGIIINKKIYTGSRGDAGEIGHMSIVSNGKPCSCGCSGCWEKYASVSALIEQVETAASSNPDSILADVIRKNRVIDGKTVFEAMNLGCPVAEDVFTQYIDFLAIGIRNIINIFRPGAVIIAGGISEAGDALLTPLINKVKSSVPIKLSHMQNDAGIIGAALLGTN